MVQLVFCKDHSDSSEQARVEGYKTRKLVSPRPEVMVSGTCSSNGGPEHSMLGMFQREPGFRKEMNLGHYQKKGDSERDTTVLA